MEQIEKMREEDLNNHLSHFILEAHRQDGALYLPDTLCQIVVGLQRHLYESVRPELAIIDQRNVKFVQVAK